jgi:hypothetical protein
LYSDAVRELGFSSGFIGFIGLIPPVADERVRNGIPGPLIRARSGFTTTVFWVVCSRDRGPNLLFERGGTISVH